LSELDVEWIAAHSPQAKARIERLLGILQDRLVKEMRVSQITTLEQANRFLEVTFWPFWAQRFTVKAGIVEQCSSSSADHTPAGGDSQRAGGAKCSQ